VIGPNAYDPHVLVANYFGIPSRAVTPLDGIRDAVSPQRKVLYTDGLQAAGDEDRRARARRQPVGGGQRRGARRRRRAVPGPSAEIEGEQGDASNSRGGGRQGST
jgi:beta-glucosidase